MNAMKAEKCLAKFSWQKIKFAVKNIISARQRKQIKRERERERERDFKDRERGGENLRIERERYVEKILHPIKYVFCQSSQKKID